MRKTSAWRIRSTGAPDRQRLRPQARRPLSPAFGLECLDQMGIDIDQDPRAFARFLELKNQAQCGR